MDFNRPELFFVGFVVLWIGILFVIARLGGRATLATFYRLSGSFSGGCWRFQSGEMRWKLGYNNCLTVGVNPAGLYLSVFSCFDSVIPISLFHGLVSLWHPAREVSCPFIQNSDFGKSPRYRFELTNDWPDEL